MGDACGSIRFYTVNLTRSDSRMKVSLKGLPDTLRGVAWPTSACAVRRPVKSGNRQDPHAYLPCAQYADCLGNEDESVGYVRWVQPESPGQHARVNGRYNGTRL